MPLPLLKSPIQQTPSTKESSYLKNPVCQFILFLYQTHADRQGGENDWK